MIEIVRAGGKGESIGRIIKNKNVNRFKRKYKKMGWPGKTKPIWLEDEKRGGEGLYKIPIYFNKKFLALLSLIRYLYIR